MKENKKSSDLCMVIRMGSKALPFLEERITSENVKSSSRLYHVLPARRASAVPILQMEELKQVTGNPQSTVHV